MTDHRNCPFCGMDAGLVRLRVDGDGYQAECDSCGARGPSHAVEKEWAMTRWDERDYRQVLIEPEMAQGLAGTRRALLEAAGQLRTVVATENRLLAELLKTVMAQVQDASTQLEHIADLVGRYPVGSGEVGV